MEPSILLLVRHAHMKENSGGSSARLCGCCDAPLSASGTDEAERLSERLAVEAPVAALYSSSLRRAAQTAQAVSCRLRLPVQMDSGLSEICCGELDGVRLSEVESLYPDLWKRHLSQNDENFRWPGGESYREFRLRVLNAIRGIAERHRGERVLVVTHSGVISQIAGFLNGTSAARWEAFRPANASITELEWARDTGKLLRFDDHAHLQPRMAA